MKINLKPLFILIILLEIFLINTKELTPLSECEKGRISKYTGWEDGGQCSFMPHKNAKGATYLYPSAPNYDFFGSTSQCGACYEIVGPFGAIRTRVESYCPKNDESGLCKGDMNHFNVANNGSSYLMGNGELANVTFRLVECGFTENIKILSDESSDKYAFSFVVLDHNLPVSSVSVQETESSTWTKLIRDEYNYWTYDPGVEIIYPIKIMIYSINGDYVTVNVEKLNEEGIYEADGNFKTVSEDTYFDLINFEKKQKPSNAEDCCERDITDFSPIFKDGQVNEYYNNHEQRVSVNYKSSELYQEQNSISATFQSFGYLTFETTYPIRADLFSGVSIAIKAPTTCSNCLYIRASDLENKIQVINLNAANKWKVYRFEFDTLGIEDNKFNGIVLGYNSTIESFEINIGIIELIGKRNRPNDGICFNFPDKEIINVNILNIKSFDEIPNLINITCENFDKISEENMILVFSTNDNSNSFETESCELPNSESINSFSCKLPDNIPNGEYNIHSSSDNAYSINYSKNILVNNGIITFDYIPEVKTDSEEKQTPITYSPIVITNSIDKEINKGDSITFQISSIEPNKFHLENKEIIFLDSTKTKALFFKDCNEYVYGNMVIAIKCNLSNNVIKGNYTILADNQNISINPDKKINIRINESNGGLFSQTISKSIDTKNLEKSELNNFNLTFNILYYNSNIKPGDLFPYKVYLYGNKKTSRNLEESKYALSILFPNCTADSYSKEDSSAIGTIRCNVPDHIPAGKYNKLTSDGFDVLPTSQINLEFTNDFDRADKADNPLVNVNIKSIQTLDDLPSLINVTCESFTKVNDGDMVLIFTTSDNSKSFKTESCTLPSTENIISFSCKIPNDLENGVYSVNTPSDNKYSINYSKNILVKDGTITFDYVSESNNSGDTNNSKMIIISSIDKTINKGDQITLQISTIDPNQYQLDNDQIIFLDSTKTKSLYLKNCQKYLYNNKVEAIKCTVSNNVIKGNYTTLADNQNLSIKEDKKIILRITESQGGIFSEIISKKIDSKNLDKSQLNNYNLSFNILYYNSNVKPGDLFPHKIYLYGNKKTLRNLEEVSILFPNCTAVSYSSEDSSAIGNIQCNVPDFIPAGVYNKIESDGFDVLPNSQINIDFTNDFNKSISNTPIINVNIISINYLDDLPFLINVTSESFNNENNENIVLQFISKDNTNSFQTESCTLPSSTNIVSFSCKIPTDIPNGEYTIQSPSTSKYSINYSKNILVKDGTITFNYSPNGSTDSTNNPTIEPIVIINSIDKEVNKGDNIDFSISSIEASKYHLENKQIIFLDTTKTKSLYLKNCQETVFNNKVEAIKCTISNNIIKGTYSILADNQNISIRSDKNINLIVNDSNGGIFSQIISRTIDSNNINSNELNNYSLSFDILYYNSNVKPGDLFPHKVYLYGNKKTLRNLEEVSILFPNCTAVSYSSEDSSAIGNIQCNVPDFIPAGVYNKIESDGFDVSPNSQINLNFPNDFRKTVINNQLINVNIINIESSENYNPFINVTCQGFNNINGENVNLLFSSTTNNSNSFQTENCILPSSENITSFTCKIPEKIKDDSYKVQSIPDSKFQVNYQKTIVFNNGVIVLNNYNPIVSTEIIETTITYSPIVIKNSIEHEIKKGDNIVFHIEDIENEKFHLDNNEIIFLDSTKKKALYLKDCEKNVYNNIVQSIRCTVNNAMKGIYISLADGQNISIMPNATIFLVNDESFGGSFSDNIIRTIDFSNLTKSELDNYILSFNILYYNSSIKPGNTFPHKVFLFGNKIQNNINRNLAEKSYDQSFSFKSCTTGKYSEDDSKAIGSIKCKLPDSISAGRYTKIQSDGFDVMPDGNINLVFPNDLNRKSSNSTYSKNDDDSSSSKTWIIWVIAGVLFAALVGIVMIACICKKKGGGEEEESKENTQNNNDSSKADIQNKTGNS